MGEEETGFFLAAKTVHNGFKCLSNQPQSFPFYFNQSTNSEKQEAMHLMNVSNFPVPLLKFYITCFLSKIISVLSLPKHSRKSHIAPQALHLTYTTKRKQECSNIILLQYFAINVMAEFKYLIRKQFFLTSDQSNSKLSQDFQSLLKCTYFYNISLYF